MKDKKILEGVMSFDSDAGHGGKDPGATAHGVKEKDWTLEISLHQYAFLSKLGVQATLTERLIKSYPLNFVQDS
ncbi:N-acetylmuramoyl-L-alanine amidase [Pseudalkalibacillus hwajinpoensis]